MIDNALSKTLQSGGKIIKEKISLIFPFKKKQQAKDNNNYNGNLPEEKKRQFNIQLSEEDDKDNHIEVDDDNDDNEDEEDIGNQAQDKEEVIKGNTNNIQDNNAIPDNKDNIEEIQDESLNDLNTYCHYLYSKGSIININDIETHKFIKLKQVKKGMLSSMFGIGNKKQSTEEEVNYLSFFDENYLYFIKDIEYDTNNPTNRRIGSRYNLFKMYNAFFDQIDNNRWKIRLEFSPSASSSFSSSSSSEAKITKVMIFNKESADRFYETLNVYFKRLNMKMSDAEFK